MKKEMTMNALLSDSLAYANEVQRYQPASDRLLEKSDTAILTGYNCQLKVVSGALHVKAGSVNGEDHESTIYYRGTHNLKQIIILSTSGNVSLEAMSWCKDQDISLVMLDHKGDVLCSMTPSPSHHISLRRAQYQLSEEQSFTIALDLVKQKTVSQFATIEHHCELPSRDAALKTLDKALVKLDRKSAFRDVADLRTFEGAVASAYFTVFVGVPLKWQTKDAKIVPPHWKAITERSSPLSTNGNARHAVNPFHAATNYMLAVTEHMLLGMIYAAGLDPQISVLQAYKENRASLMFDCIEPLQAVIDDNMLNFFGSNTIPLCD